MCQGKALALSPVQPRLFSGVHEGADCCMVMPNPSQPRKAWPHTDLPEKEMLTQDPCPALHPNLDRGQPSPPFLVAVCSYQGWVLGCNLATECCAVGCPGNQGSLSLGLLGVPGRGSTLRLCLSTLLRRLKIPEGEWQWHGRSISDWSSKRKRLRECCQEQGGGGGRGG